MGPVELTRTKSNSRSRSTWVGRGLRARWALLACYAILTAGWYVTFLSGWDPLGFSVRSDGSPISFGIGTLILVSVQTMLLAGAPQRNWPRPRGRRSMVTSLLAGSAIAVLLSAGIFCAASSFYRVVWDPGWFHVTVTNVQVTSTPPTTAPASPPAPVASAGFSWATDVPWGIVGLLLAGWTFWFLVFALVGGGEWPRRFGRMYRMLLAGTVLELLITIPIDAQVRRRTQCYCDEGTFFALAIGLTAILWTFGPGVAILFLVRRRQRLLASGCCIQCGYDLRGITSARCPECGVSVIARPG